MFSKTGPIALIAVALSSMPLNATTVNTSADQLLAAGYEVKDVHYFKAEDAKTSFNNTNVTSDQVTITLQRGNSSATCVMAAISWIVQTDSVMADATLCFKH